MQKVLTAEQMREVDRLTTERYGIPSILLMENAAHAVARVITEKLGGSVKGKSVLILCGKGNNGGDGAALGRILCLSGADVELILFGKTNETKGEARINFAVSQEIVNSFHEIQNKKAWNTWLSKSEKNWDVVVDAIFGTGLTRDIEGWLAQVINEVLGDNACARFKGRRLAVSVDLPSGMNSDLDNSSGAVLEADVTVTFTSPKLANVLPPACNFGGELIVSDIGSAWELIDEVDSQLFLATELDAFRWLSSAAFSLNDYKNKRGHALIIAGSEDYSGAAVMCGNSAMRSGVGLVTLLVPASCKVEVASRVIPEVIVRTFSGQNELLNPDAFAENQYLLQHADSILVGPGLSATDIDIERFVWEIVETRTRPVIVDASILGFFVPPVGFPELKEIGNTRAEMPVVRPPLILTPHEGEFMRLLGTDDKSVIKDRVAAVREFSVANNVILVLKGERVLIGSPDGRVVVNPTGNSGLGKAGNGDTLAGILAGFVAQAVKFEIDIFETVIAAVYIAGMAGEVAEKKYGKRVMTASDVRECLADVFQDLENR